MISAGSEIKSLTFGFARKMSSELLVMIESRVLKDLQVGDVTYCCRENSSSNLPNLITLGSYH